MKNNALVILIILLLVSVGLNVYQSKKEVAYKKGSNIVLSGIEAKIRKHIAWEEWAQGRIDSINSKRIRDSLSYKSRLIARNEEIQAYKKTIIRLRPLVAAKIDSFPDLREFVSNQDSVISKQDSLLHDTELFCQLQVRDLQDIIRLQEQKYHAQAEISEAWREQALESQAEAKKERRGKKFWRAAATGITAIALYLAVK